MTISSPPTGPAIPAGSPEFQRFIRALPPDMVGAFSRPQLLAMAEALKPSRAPHWIDVRASVPLPKVGFYVVLMVGRERRNRARLAAEGQIGLKPAIILGAALSGIVLMGTLVAVLGLHLMLQTIGPGLLPAQLLLQPL